MLRSRAALFTAVLTSAFVLGSAPAPAALDMVVGARRVVQNEPVSTCSSKAKTALSAQLPTVFEAGDGTGQWLGYGTADSTGHSSAAAAIHCYPVGNGYVVTFTCAVDQPPNPEDASTLCGKLAGSFGGP